jgi:hypothetical protein
VPVVTTFDKANATQIESAFVTLRPSDKAGIANIGITVPDLEGAPSSIWSRWFAGKPATGLGIVPVAEMRLIGFSAAGPLFDVIRPVGVTSLWFSIAITILAVAAIFFVLQRIVAAAPPAVPVAAPPPAGPIATVVGRLRTALTFDWVLMVIRGPDGRASLSAFQVLLWTTTVVASAVFVMALSGNLINITTGTLTLLGIAGAASLLVATQGPGDAGQAAQPGQPAQPPPAPVRPQWSHLVLGNDNNPDVTRVQMLVFTVVSASFVLMQVFNTYVIPDIPLGYQLLMGISNGIYVGRKFAKQ